MNRKFFDFFIKEWLLSISIALFIISILYTKHLPNVAIEKFKPIILLYFLFIAIKAIEKSEFLLYTAKKLEQSKYIEIKLIILAFIFSALFNIDIAIVALLPLVLKMKLKNRDFIAILVAFSTHLGGALLPFSTPQNLFIYSYYDIKLIDFIKTIAPFSFGMLFLFLLATIFLQKNSIQKNNIKIKIDKKNASINTVLLILVVGVIIDILPIYTLILIFLYTAIFNRDSLKIDYIILIIFTLFLLTSSNIASLFHNFGGNIFLNTSLLSQIISNVPATLIVHNFTNDYKELLWGANVGSFGTLIASLANVLTFRIYTKYNKNSTNFLLKLTLYGTLCYFLGVVIYIFAT